MPFVIEKQAGLYHACCMGTVILGINPSGTEVGIFEEISENWFNTMAAVVPARCVKG